MRLHELRRRIAAAIDPDTPAPAPQRPAELEPLEAPPITPMPGQAQPLTDDQRANLEKLRDRYAPDRQKRGPGVDNPLQRAAENTGVSMELMRRVTGQNEPRDMAGRTEAERNAEYDAGEQ